MTPQDIQQRINLNVNQHEFNIVMASLQEMPFKIADPLIKNFLQQAKNQLDQQTNQGQQ